MYGSSACLPIPHAKLLKLELKDSSF